MLMQAYVPKSSHLVSANACYEILIRLVVRIECHTVDRFAVMLLDPESSSSKDGVETSKTPMMLLKGHFNERF